MRLFVLTILLSFSFLKVTEARVLSFSDDDLTLHHAQNDEPQTEGGKIERLVTALQETFGDLLADRNTWYNRYDALANSTASNSASIVELLTISRIAMPIIWNSFTANTMRQRSLLLHQGYVGVYVPSPALPAPHPLQNIYTGLRDNMDFVVETTLKLKREANVGFRLMYEPEGEQEFSWDDGDILFAAHLRWHCQYENDREVVLNDKYNGNWGPVEARTREDKWPQIHPGEKFQLTVIKKGKCFQVLVVPGAEMYHQLIEPPSYVHAFCPQPRRRSKMEPIPRNLRVVVNEDNRGTGELEVYGITWYPTEIYD